MLYYICGRIDPRKTGEGRHRAQAGDFDPPSAVRHHLEYEEPDGSYFELVETGDPDNVRLYMKKSSHLFVSYEFYEALLLEQAGETGGWPCYALFYTSSGPALPVAETSQVKVVLHVHFGGNRGVMVVQTGLAGALYKFTAGMLPSVMELRTVPVMRAAQVWEVTRPKI